MEVPEITYEKWFPDVPSVMDSQQLAELLGVGPSGQDLGS
jgi:hypothetical protein